MKERPVLLGEQKSLLGIVTEPPRDVASESAPGVVLINAGLVHRIGPNRLYVKLARQLAALGLPVLRFDLSGLGDSRARTDGVPIDERAVVETRTAMSYLASTRQLERFVLVGLCSGADDAFRTACADPRVVGLLLIDPCLYPSTSHTVHGYLRRLIRPRAWVSLLTGKSDLWKRVGQLARPASPGAATEAAWDWKQIPGDELRTGLETLARRGVHDPAGLLAGRLGVSLLPDPRRAPRGLRTGVRPGGRVRGRHGPHLHPPVSPAGAAGAHAGVGDAPAEDGPGAGERSRRQRHVPSPMRATGSAQTSTQLTSSTIARQSRYRDRPAMFP